MENEDRIKGISHDHFKNILSSRIVYRWSGKILDNQNQLREWQEKMVNISKPFTKEEIKAAV